MIYVTVGTQLPFERLIRAVERWNTTSEIDVIAQIGPSKEQFAFSKTYNFIDPLDAERLMDEADLIVAHAGIGSILSALQRGKPIVVLPRLAELHEHRNDHQLATAKRFRLLGNVHVAFSDNELIGLLNNWRQLTSLARIPAEAPASFLREIRRLIDA